MSTQGARTTGVGSFAAGIIVAPAVPLAVYLALAESSDWPTLLIAASLLTVGTTVLVATIVRLVFKDPSKVSCFTLVLTISATGFAIAVASLTALTFDSYEYRLDGIVIRELDHYTTQGLKVIVRYAAVFSGYCALGALVLWTWMRRGRVVRE